MTLTTKERLKKRRSATLSLCSYPDHHDVTASFPTRDEAEAFLDYLEKVGP
jgi:hypothetical protein